ncbi:Uncharacterized protein FKW44_024824 [Caligus rogercresseyi]|uniref:Uncharacterized protein n=1 Tax=Caligus rogercresseyi TaxID=217165 RepID=A0A7T8GM53_CALRO|nr:Uncharacterized protein FKW44_024824 [Caligus rogercresseyi]
MGGNEKSKGPMGALGAGCLLGASGIILIQRLSHKMEKQRSPGFKRMLFEGSSCLYTQRFKRFMPPLMSLNEASSKEKTLK